MATVSDGIMELIKASPRGLKTKEIRERLGVPGGSVTGRASELAKRGILERRDGAYYLKVTKAVKTHYCLLVDKSTSMSGDNDQNLDRRPAAARLFNRQLQALRESENDVTVTTKFFAGRMFVGVDIATINRQVPARALGDIDARYPTSTTGTALLDALVEALQDCDASDATAKTVFCFTDGEENNSRTSWLEFASQLVAAQVRGNFTLAILVPAGGRGEKLLREHGVPEKNILSWDDIDEAEKVSTQCTVAFEREVKTSGGATRQTKHYFQADLSKVTAADLEKQLEDVTASVRHWTAQIETDIESYISAKVKGDYVPGTGFFEVMKAEKRIAPDRKLILMNPATNRFFTGNVRKLCGYPESGEFAIKPGNHAGFVLFCQSKSSSKDTFRARILPRGTRVLHWAGAVS